MANPHFIHSPKGDRLYCQPYGWYLYKEQGWKGGKIPPDFEGHIVHQGVMFVVKPTVKGPRKSSKHRIFYPCKCGQDIPFGRMWQHFKACKEEIQVTYPNDPYRCMDCGSLLPTSYEHPCSHIHIEREEIE